MREKGFIQYIAIIIIILAIVFLSQQPYFMRIGKNIYGQIESQVGFYWSKATDWVMSNIYPRVSSEIVKRGGVIKEEINKEKNNFMQNIWDNIKNYFLNIFSKTTGAQVQ